MSERRIGPPITTVVTSRISASSSGPSAAARTALAVAERFDAILDDAALALDGHRLVNLRVTELASERDKDSGLTRVTLRLRAVTEAA
jgi:hypothetical protein